MKAMPKGMKGEKMKPGDMGRKMMKPGGKKC